MVSFASQDVDIGGVVVALLLCERKSFIAFFHI